MPFGLHQNTSLMRIFPALNKEIFLAMESFSLRFWRVVCLTACSRIYQLKVSVVSAVILLKLQNHLRNPRRAQHLIYIMHADNNFMMVWAVQLGCICFQFFYSLWKVGPWPIHTSFLPINLKASLRGLTCVGRREEFWTMCDWCNSVKQARDLYTKSCLLD